MKYPEPGGTFGPYDIVREIGRGGMGVVYAAVQRGLQREVALKLLAPYLAGTEEHRRRFEREARVLARLESPHIITVYDAGEVDGIFYIATQLVGDGDLSALLHQAGPMPVGVALEAGAQVAQGLADAHAAGVLHRDIKPSNVLVRRTGADLRYYLCDLGISYVLDSEHTRTSAVMGTLGYMSPERHQGADASVASDVYAMGCLLWAMVTGRAPYEGTDMQVAMAHISQPIPQLAAHTPEEQHLNRVIRTAMAKDPAQRFASAAGLQAALSGRPAPGTRPETAPAAPPAMPPTVPPPPHPPTQAAPPLRPPPPYAPPYMPTGGAPGGGSRRGLVVGVTAAVAVLVALAAVLVVVLTGDDEPERRRTGGDPPATTSVSGTTTSAAPTEVPTDPTAIDPGFDPEDPPPVVLADSGRFNGPAPEVAGAVEGGTLRLHLPGSGPDTLDPAAAWLSSAAILQQSLVSRTLTQYVRDPDTGATELAPDLATDLGTHNADYTEWSFTIRDGVRWQDGSPVTAEQVAFGLTRTLDYQAFPGGIGSTYTLRYFADTDGYEGPYTDPDRAYRGITVSGNTLTIKMKEPFPGMPWFGATLASSPVPTGTGAEDLTTDPGATGPYLVENFTPSRELTLVRNPEWDPATDPGRHAYPDRIEVAWQVDPLASAEAVAGGDGPLVAVGLPASTYERLAEARPERVLVQPNGCLTLGLPDWDKTGGDSEKGRQVRAAMAYGYDAEPTWVQAGELPDVTRFPAATLLPPGTLGSESGAAHGFDPTRARQLLKQAGYGPGKKFTLKMAYDPSRPGGEEIQATITRNFEEAGFKVKAFPEPGLTSIMYYEDSSLNKKLNFRPIGWCQDWPEAGEFLTGLLGPGSLAAQGGFPSDQLLAFATDVRDRPLDDQAALWSDFARETLGRDVAAFPTGYNALVHAASEDVGGVAPDTGTGTVYYKDLFVLP